jgi:hypothetical protein
MKQQVFYVGCDGGSLSIYRERLGKHDWYYSGEEIKSMSFEEEFIKLNAKYPDLLSLYPIFVDESCINIVIFFLKNYQLNNRFIETEAWARVLNISEDKFKVDNPMYTYEEYLELKAKYGNVASWALWDDENLSDTRIIENNIGWLNSRFVGVGLNISKPVSAWSNFRSGKHDRKLKMAFNKGRFKGFYLTDILKNVVNPNSKKVQELLKYGEIDLKPHIDFFIQEMKDIKVNDETVFVTFGYDANYLFETYLKKEFPNNEIVHLKHYSARGTDKQWVYHALAKMGFLEEYLNNGIFEDDFFDEQILNEPSSYKSRLMHSINKLIESEQEIFGSTLNLFMAGENKEFDECFNIGDVYKFRLEHLESAKDENVRRLVALIKEIRKATEILMIRNNISEDDINAEG